MSESNLRFRGTNKTIEKIKTLDAFPKIQDSYVETTASGAAITILTSLFITFLVISEIAYYFDTRFEYDYTVDVEFDTKVWLNFDITIASSCGLIGADVVDATDQVMIYDAKIMEEPAVFNSQTQAPLRGETLTSYEDGQQLNEMALKQSYYRATRKFAPNRDKINKKDADACRFYGNIPLTKVSGNFHIVSGKPMALFGSHAHLSFVMPNVHFNFSHRIDHLSFGDMKSGLVNALDGMQKIVSDQNYVYQYYLDIVSTKVRTRWLHSDTFQFSVSELSRKLDHSAGSHGMPGIFFKYGFSPVCVTIKDHTMSFGKFLIRLCGIVGGIFATSCIVNGLINAFHDFFAFLQSKNKQSKSAATKHNSTDTNQSNVQLLSQNFR